jgi:hypothetical protein
LIDGIRIVRGFEPGVSLIAVWLDPWINRVMDWGESVDHGWCTLD